MSCAAPPPAQWPAPNPPIYALVSLFLYAGVTALRIPAENAVPMPVANAHGLRPPATQAGGKTS